MRPAVGGDRGPRVTAGADGAGALSIAAHPRVGRAGCPVLWSPREVSHAASGPAIGGALALKLVVRLTGER